MHAFCTYFDSKYLDKGLCLWGSLKAFSKNFRLYVCCLDDAVHRSLTTLSKPEITLVRLADVEAAYPDLAAVRPRRSPVEYIFTLTPSLVRHVLDTTDHPSVTYLDSDLLFFSDPQALFDELAAAGGHVGIIAHRFVEHLRHLDIHGTYNVGWVTFCRSPQAMACLLDWQRRCIEWCHDRVEGDRFADQKYLDAWPVEHEGVVVLGHPGANVALWNLRPGSIRRRGRRLVIDEHPLVFYHFHGLSQVGPRTFFTSARTYGAILDATVTRFIYKRYIALLRQVQRGLRSVEFHPLIRYKYTYEDVSHAKQFPRGGTFLSASLLDRLLLGVLSQGEADRAGPVR